MSAFEMIRRSAERQYAGLDAEHREYLATHRGQCFVEPAVIAARVIPLWVVERPSAPNLWLVSIKE